MLILTRRAGETITIGDAVRVTILDVRGTQIRIGVDAPKDVAVHREEVAERIERESAPPPIQLAQPAPVMQRIIIRKKLPKSRS